MADQTPSTSQDILRIMTNIIAEQAMIDADKITPDTLLADLDIQSADHVMILMAVEEEFGIYLSMDSDLAEAKTVSDLARIVATRIEERQSGAAA